MGLIRKTLSISTLGIINFRSKKEKLQRAEQARAAVEAALDNEKQKTAALESVTGSRTARKAIKQQTKGRAGRRARAETTLAELIDAAREASASAAADGRQLGRRARKQANRSLKEAEKSLAKARKKAKGATIDLREKADEALAQLAKR